MTTATPAIQVGSLAIATRASGVQRSSKGACAVGDMRAWARYNAESCPSMGSASCRQGHPQHCSITCHATGGGCGDAPS
jgi:hypothetical protein